MGLLDRLAPRRSDAAATTSTRESSADDAVFATKALKKFLHAIATSASPVLLDLGPVVGSNVSFFGEQLGCKIFVEDVFADLERHKQRGTLDEFPAFLKSRFEESDGSIDGILCWDVFDYLDRASAASLAEQLTRVLRPSGTLLGFFGTTRALDARYIKYIVVDEVSLKYRPYGQAGGRQGILLNRDIIRLFSGLRVTDSFLLQNNLREILFRKA